MRKKQGSRLGKSDLPANKTNKRSEASMASGAAFPPDSSEERKSRYCLTAVNILLLGIISAKLSNVVLMINHTA